MAQAQHGAGAASQKRKRSAASRKHTIPFSPCYIGPIKNENKSHPRLLVPTSISLLFYFEYCGKPEERDLSSPFPLL